MNLKLNEWNNINEYANEICNSLKSKGYNIKPKSYSMHDGRKGLYLQVFDNENNFFTQYATGIHTNLSDMKNAIDSMVKRIVTEC